MPFGLTKSAHLTSGSSQAFYRANNAAFNPSSFTIEAWIKRDGGGSGCIAAKGNTGNYIGQWVFTANGTTLSLYTSNGSNHTTTGSVSFTPTQDVWYHVAATYSGGTIKFYVNGVQQGTGQSGEATIGTGDTDDFLIGCQKQAGNYNSFFDGRISLVRFWNAIRTVTQINDNKCNVFGGATTNLVAEWTLNDVVTDGSGNAFTLTNLNSTPFVSDINGVCVPPSSIKSINGLASASIKSINGLAMASVKSFNGLA